MNDWELLQAYSRDRSEEAFETLVKRHVDFVYHSALRQVRDPQLAEDVSQAVFLLLARKSGSFRSGTILVSWLFRTTQFIAARALRSEHRRQRREHEAAIMNPQTSIPEADHHWEQVSPLLDEALATLPGKDRDAILLRFISRKPFGQVGAELGVSEDAAKKRVERALDRLREFFGRRGVTLASATLLTLIAERAVQAAPAAVASKIAAGLGAGAGAASTFVVGLVQAAMNHLFWTRVRYGLGATVAVVAIVAAVSLAGPSTRVSDETTNSSISARLPESPAATNTPELRSANVASASRDGRKMSLLIAQADNRQPIPGARVLAECVDPAMRETVQEATTDEQGMLDIPIPERSFNTMLIWVSAADHVPMVMKWKDHEFNETVTIHTLLLDQGWPAGGVILDEAGHPVSGVKVSFGGPGADLSKRECPHFHPRLSATVTDAAGRWTTGQLPPSESEVSIRLNHADFVPVDSSLAGQPGFPTNLVLILSNGVALSGRVLNAEGSPIANARVVKQSNPPRSAYLTKQTDQEGRFSWRHLEPGRVWMEIEADGFEPLQQYVATSNAENEAVFKLTASSAPGQPVAEDAPRIRVHGTVVDAETGAPVPRFQVLIGDDWEPPRPVGAERRPSGAEQTLTRAELLGEGHDGQFDWPAVARAGTFRLQVEAEGYLEATADSRDLGKEGAGFSFKLKRRSAFAGRVVTPDGNVAAGARIALAGFGYGAVMHKPGELVEPNTGFESTRTQTDQEGRFVLNLKSGTRGAVVIHETGCAVRTIPEATNAAIVLQPWATIEGTLVLAGKPAPHQRVSVTGSLGHPSDPRLLLSFTFSTQTDDEGRFIFRKVPPGEHLAVRDVGFFGEGPAIVNHSHATLVTVKAGETALIELRRPGRTVLGRMAFQGSPSDIQWGMSQALLSLEGNKAPTTDYERAPAASSRAAQMHRAQTRFPFILAKDGSMRADDVPPGSYNLSINLVRASADPMQFEKSFGSLQQRITVPASEDENQLLDLGVLTIPQAD